MSNLSIRERLQERRRSQQSRSSLTWIIIIVAVIASVVYLVWITFRPAEGTAVPLEGETHIANGTDPGYLGNPPSSGGHYEGTLPGGFYEQADLQDWSPFPEGYAVHNLEHGYIVFWYNCAVVDEATCDEMKTQIRNFLSSALTRKLIALPWDKTDTPLVLTSWGYQLEMPVFDAGRASAFIATNAPRAPEPNAQ